MVDGRNFAVVATVNPDGSPQTSVVWVGLDGDAVVFSTTAARRKTRNILRDPRVSVTVIDDPERTLGHRLSHKYVGEDPPPEPPSVRRVIIRVTPEKVTGFAA